MSNAASCSGLPASLQEIERVQRERRAQRRVELEPARVLVGPGTIGPLPVAELRSDLRCPVVFPAVGRPEGSDSQSPHGLSHREEVEVQTGQAQLVDARLGRQPGRWLLAGTAHLDQTGMLVTPGATLTGPHD